MKGWGSGGLLVGLCILLLTGCTSLISLPYAKEIEGVTLARVLGVDTAVGLMDGVAVTAVSGVQNLGEESPKVFQAEGSTLPGAGLALQTQGTADISFAHVDQILLGEALAQRGIDQVLQYVMEDRSVGLGATLWVLKGGRTGEIAGEIEELAQRLEALESDRGLEDVPLPRTVREVAAGLAQDGCTFAPALAGVGNELIPAGYAILKGGALVGYADGPRSYGVELLQGEVFDHVVEVETPSCQTGALRVTAAHTQIRGVWQGDRLTGLAVECRLEAILAETQGEMDRHWVQNELERIEAERIRLALEQAQGLNCDYLALWRRAALAEPWKKAALAEQWPEAFPKLELSIQVESKLAR